VAIITTPTPSDQPGCAVAAEVEDDLFIEQPKAGGDNGVFQQCPIGRRQPGAPAAGFAEAARPVSSRHQDIAVVAGNADDGLASERMVPAHPVNLVGGISL
jgi:hypothetical protein